MDSLILLAQNLVLVILCNRWYTLKLFWNYIKEIKSGITFFILSFVLLLITFFLYQLPLLAVLYPFILIFVGAMVFVGFNFYSHRKKVRSLEELENIIEEQSKKIKSLQFNETELKDTYTTWVHQIKTPIASMKLSLQNEDSELSRKMQSELSRIDQYVEMVLAVVRMQSNTTDFVFKEVSLDSIISQAVKRFSTEFISKKIKLEYSPLEKTILTDEKWFLFVLEQILSNSLKYTKHGSIKIYMHDNSLCIEDTGIGISADELPRIFQKGYTGTIGRLDKKASGIGLYICKKICDSLNHDLSVKSTVDVGTIVRILF